MLLFGENINMMLQIYIVANFLDDLISFISNSLPCNLYSLKISF